MNHIHNNFVTNIMKEIEANNLLTESLEDFFKTNILRVKKPSSKHSDTVSKNCKMVKEMFKGVVEHKLCLAVAQKMTKLMREDDTLSLESACYKGAEEMNAKRGNDLFPMTEEAFEALLAERNGCRIVHEED